MNLTKAFIVLVSAAMCAAANAGTEELFRGAAWIEAPAGMNAAAPRFTTTFKVEKDGPAEIAICGLGQYVATLNGRPLGRGDEFNLPGWTRTSKTCFYNVFAPQLKAGEANTTCHEAWDCREDLSYNHFMMADIVNWFYGALAGIKRTAPGFKTFTVAPEFLPGLDWVEASHTAAGGDIRVEWRRGDGKIDVKVSVPEGTVASVRLPGLPEVEQAPGEKTYTITQQERSGK